VTVSLAQVAALLVALQQRETFAACILAVLVGWLVALVLGLVLVARGAPGFPLGAPARRARRLGEAMGFGMPLQLANGIAVMHQQFGKLLIVRMLSLAAVVPYELGLPGLDRVQHVLAAAARGDDPRGLGAPRAGGLRDGCASCTAAPAGS
jgi:O-antigen/teichoic acid export membrane protein